MSAYETEALRLTGITNQTASVDCDTAIKKCRSPLRRSITTLKLRGGYVSGSTTSASTTSLTSPSITTSFPPEMRCSSLAYSPGMMLNHGIPVIVVSRRLGHANASITLNVYAHLIPDKQSEAAELIDDLIVPVPVELQV